MTLTTIAAVFYLASSFLIYKRLKNQQSTSRWISLTPVLLALIIHTLVLNSQIYQPDGLNLGLLTAASLIAWLVCIQILLSSIYRPLESLGIIMFPLSAILMMLSQWVPSIHIVALQAGQLLQSHIMLSVVAYSLLMLAVLQAILLSVQDHALRAHHPGGIIRFMPPMHDMETLLFQMLGFAFLFLSTALISGFIFLDDLFAQHLVHKTVLSIIGWFILAILLFGRFRFGWRGKSAVRWTIASFFFLMLAYFGSKLVLEFII